MRKDWVYRRGDLYLADLSPVTGSEEGGKNEEGLGLSAR